MGVNEFITFGVFTGINNVSADLRPTSELIKTPAGVKTAYSARDILNLDIDNNFGLISRVKHKLQTAGTNMHSLWSDGDTCFCVDGDSLYLINPDLSLTSILSGLTIGAWLTYLSDFDRIYFSNGTIIKYYKDSTLHDLPVPATKFKLPLPPGKFMAKYRSRIYLAAGRVLYITDPLSDHYDTRYGFRPFESDITMVRAVDDGLYISDSDNTHFLKGNDLDELIRLQVDDSSAIPYTDLTIDGKYFTEGRENSNYAIWTSQRGICVGDNDGNVKNVTSSRYVLGDYSRGSAVLRSVDGLNHYLVTLE